MTNVKDRLLEAILDPNERDRVLAVSELVYGIEDLTRSISLMLAGLAQLTAAKKDDVITRELYAVKNVVDETNIQLEKYWFVLRLHHAQTEETRPADSTIH